MIRRVLLLFALFLATPAIVGAFDAWAFVMIGRTLVVDWIGGRMEAASVMGCLAVAIGWLLWMLWEIE